MKYEKGKIKILPKPSPGPSALQTPPPAQNSPAPVMQKRKSTSSITSSTTNESKKQKKSNPSTPSTPLKANKPTGHRPVTSCTFCRQHKIKCNASENFPNPCERCKKMGLKCEIDPEFRPRKGSQIQSLKLDVDELKAKIEMLTKNESLLTQALNQHNLNFSPSQQSPPPQQAPMPLQQRAFSSPANVSPIPSITSIQQNAPLTQENSDNSPSTMNTPDHAEEYQPISEFILGDVTLPLNRANELHDKFMTKHLPFLPIIISRSATELYHKSQLLFWAVILTASLSEPEPTLYMSLASLIKQLAIETCWIKTPRSTHVIQALIILSIWPLPNEKVLDDCSYRFVGLAKNLSLQLGLHRGGEFIQEFSRNQVSLGPDAERWRTRSWLAVFFCEQFWSSLLGLPPSIGTTDYLLENARVDKSLPKDFRCLISLSIFQCKLVNVMGISVTRPDGLLEPLNRAGSLSLLDRELERLRFKLQFEEGSAVEVYYLYIKLMICCFAFLPGTPIEDQVKYVSFAYLSATRIVTIVSQMINDISLIELPIYIRQAVSYSVLLLFKLHLSRYLIEKYVDSARQLIVTVHRLFRNTLSSWKDLQNDISRTARVLENLNIVLYTYPDIFLKDVENEDASIITRMRSHLTASLFYDLVWCVHEARRRSLLDKGKKKPEPNKKLMPLPFYNQITKDDFKTITTTTPNGTTVTTLVPTDEAMNQAKLNGNNKPLEINGIPLAMLEATGSTRDMIEGLPQLPSSVPPPRPSSQPTQQGAPPTPQPPLSRPGSVAPPVVAQQPPPPPQSQQFALPQAPFILANSPIPQSYLPKIEETGLPTEIKDEAVASQISTFFEQQTNGWLSNENHDDDFLGWFDMNMMQEQ
ncbi:Transcriptional regulatory protein SEF1 [Candida viswanathii]|uniref:Transcriptional regulatory protein SEF1 n=1 Tax=Candida viswanathii TaxID=5486 RepID=A0A367Y1D3_9ASCO|nr:Transcriptional regulatory protein SEF1 [Candida viswanathii]